MVFCQLLFSVLILFWFVSFISEPKGKVKVVNLEPADTVYKGLQSKFSAILICGTVVLIAKIRQDYQGGRKL